MDLLRRRLIKAQPDMPLTFDILTNGDITWKITQGNNPITIFYSKNGGGWTSITSSAAGATIPVVAGDVLKFIGETWPGEYQKHSTFGSTCNFAAKGNPASLRYGLAATKDSPLSPHCFSNLFLGCTGLVSAPSLPRTLLDGDFCYSYMFSGCTALTTAPELPATTLANNCYQYMFQGCTSLTIAPELPATTLSNTCYAGMFDGCTSLTTAPELPATTIADTCYQYMFRGCTNLVNIPSILPATTLASRCYNGMFQRCSALTAAPDLPARNLTVTCYANMFQWCSSLSSVKCYADDLSVYQCLNSWLASVPASGTFTKRAGVTYPSGANGIPAGWTVIEV